jgi:D-xylono/L-arabinono-1,4-lactonase
MQFTETCSLVAPTSCEIGEGPLWHPDAGIVLFLDIADGVIYSYTPSTGKYGIFSRGPITGGMTLQEDGNVLLFQDGRISILQLDGTQHEVGTGYCRKNERFNDVAADPEGRVFAGTTGGGHGRLLRFERDGSFTQLLDGIGCPNGMGFTADNKGMYFTDSVQRRIYLFDYDRKTGVLSNQRTFADIPKQIGAPDGMTVDTEGFVWTAIWFGGRVRRYAPDGRLDREVYLPVTQPSAIIFGGPNLRDIYVTSASTAVANPLTPPGFDLNAPRGGGLFAFRVEGVSGKLLFRSRVDFGS